MFAAVERLSMAGKTLLAPRIDESGVWRDGGHRSPAVMLAELEGVPTGQARNTLEVGHRLTELPGTEEALRSGALSGPKVTELSGAAVLDPASEGEPAGRRGGRAAPDGEGAMPAGPGRPPSARTRWPRCGASMRARHFASWTDADGAFCFQGRDTADRGARILEQMEHTVGRLRDADRGHRAAGSDAAGRPGPADPGPGAAGGRVLPPGHRWCPDPDGRPDHGRRRRADPGYGPADAGPTPGPTPGRAPVAASAAAGRRRHAT